MHGATALSEEQRARLDTQLTAALTAHHRIAHQSHRLTQGKALTHGKIVNAYDPTIAPICKGKSNCPAPFGRRPGILAEPAAGFIFALHLSVGNPSDASYVQPLVDNVQQAIARVATSPRPAIHSLAGDLAFNDASLREALHQPGILTVGIPHTVDPLPQSPTPEDVLRFLSEGWKAYPAALLQVVGRVYQRRRRGNCGRHPKPRLVPPQDLFYGQVVKVRDRKGHLLRVVSRVVYGGPRRCFREMRRRGLGATIQTAFMERWYGTLRGLCAPLRRRTRCGSSSQRRHQARVWLVVDLYNFVLPHKSLRQQGRPHTPAMAIGLAEQVWSYRDYLWYPVHPDPVGRHLIEQRVKELLTPALEAG